MVSLMLVGFGLAGIIIAGLIIVAGWFALAYLTVSVFFRSLTNIPVRFRRRWRWVGYGSW